MKTNRRSFLGVLSGFLFLVSSKAASRKITPDQEPSLVKNDDSSKEELIQVVILENGSPKMVWLPKKKALEKAVWGTYGKSGRDPLKWVRIGDCSTEHLGAILRTQDHIEDGVRWVILKILKMR